MSFGIVRVQKMTSGSVRGIEIHDERKSDVSHTNPDIDHEKSLRNLHIRERDIECGIDREGFPKEDYYQAVKRRIGELSLTRAVRKDAIVMAQVLVTSDAYFFMELTETKQFFSDAYNFLADRFGRENIIAATVHYDEQTPHMHFNFVPVTKDGRLSAKDVLSKQSFVSLHDDFYAKVGKKYGLERGEGKKSGKRQKHYETDEYKEALAQAAEVDQMTQKARLRADEVERAILPLETYKNALEGEIERLETQKTEAVAVISDLAGKVGDATQELNVVRLAVKKEHAAGVAVFGMNDWKRSIAEAKESTGQSDRLRLFERFVELPQIKPIWEKFCQMVQSKSKGINIEDRGGRV